MDKSLSRKYLFIFIILVYVIFQSVFLTKISGVWVDEPWYANTAYNFSQGNGLINTVPGSGAGVGLFLYTLILSLFFKLFGTSILVARFVSVIAGLFAIIGLLKVLKQLEINQDKIVFLVSLLFIFSNVYYIVFRTVRPESFIVSIVIWALYFLIKAYNSSSKINYFLAGLLSSAIFLVHPHGAFYIFIFGIFCLVISINRKKIIPVLYYSCGVLFIFLILAYHIYFIRGENIIEFFSPWMTRTSVNGSSTVSNFINNISVFFNQYTLGIKRLYILIFEIGILITGLFFWKKNKKIFIFSLFGVSYFILALLSLSVFATRHFGEVIIFSLIVFALILNYFKNNKKVLMLFVTIGSFYLLNNFTGDLYLIYKDHNRTSYSIIEKKIDGIIPDNTKVLTLMNFWFPLKNNDNYNSYTRWEKKDYKNLDDFIDSGDAEYVVISDYLTKNVTATSGRIDLSNKNKNNRYYNLVYSYAENQGILLETIKTNGYGNIEIWKIVNDSTLSGE